MCLSSDFKPQSTENTPFKAGSDVSVVANLKYEYYIQMNDPETVLLIDSWTSQEALDLHHASPMMETIAKLREKYDLHMSAQRYISDNNGVPERDSGFLRK